MYHLKKTKSLLRNVTSFSKNMFVVVKMKWNPGSGGGGTSIRTPPRAVRPRTLEDPGPNIFIVNPKLRLIKSIRLLNYLYKDFNNLL